MGAALALSPPLLDAGCARAPLEERACPCVTPDFKCCESLQLCLRPEQSCAAAADWAAPPAVSAAPAVSMDGVTVFAFSQVALDGDDNTIGRDEQVQQVLPDMVIRGWGQWDNQGTSAAQFSHPSYLQDCQSQGILFMGGGTATALFQDQAPQDFARWVTLDVDGNPVAHDDLNLGEFRGSLANPEFRQKVIEYGRYQIDAGVDGLQYSDVNADYQGSMPDSNGNGNLNEGFDAYHLADFNAFLLAKYPRGDYQARFGMADDNLLRMGVAPGDLDRNFDFARYLRSKGRHTFPLADGDPLVAEWGTVKAGMPAFLPTTFVDTAEPYHYWSEIVRALRDYAQQTRADPAKQKLIISANGMFPFVDFVSAGIYDSPEIHQQVFTFSSSTGPDGTPAHRLDGRRSAKGDFEARRRLAAMVAPGAPVVVYLDGAWSDYHDLLLAHRRDFWRIYAAQAYASGIFFAFLLKAPASGANSYHPTAIAPPTAADEQTLSLIEQLAGFYRGHADLYHGVTWSDALEASVAIAGGAPILKPNVDVTVADQPPSAARSARRIVHVVSHEYDSSQSEGSGLTLETNVAVTFPVTGTVTAVTVASPDFDPPADVTLTPVPGGDGTITVTLPTLAAYDVISAWY